MLRIGARILAGLVAILWLAAPGPVAADPAPDCSLCGAELSGSFTVFQGLEWDVCDSCMARPKCHRCNLPLAGRLEADGEHCTRCLASAPGCTECARPLVEKYWTIAGVDGRFCETCRNEAAACSVCGAPARNPRLADGRVFCPHCSRAQARDPGRHAEIFDRVVSRAAEVLGLRVEQMPELVIANAEQIAAARGDQPHRDDVSGLYCRDETGRPTIHLLSHLPEARAAAVLAHEFAHAWQAEHCPDLQGLRLREGFAEWVSWKILEGMPGMEAEREVIRSRTDDYGLGFRAFLELERNGGTSRALWYAQAARTD